MNTTLITGATSGIGRAIAVEMAKRGCSLVLISRDQGKMVSLKEVLEKEYGISVSFFVIDLSESQAAEKVLYFCQENNFEITTLVNNAGFGIATQMEFTHPNLLTKMITLHTLTPTKLCSFFAAEMKKRKHGYILNVSSIVAVTPAASTLTYSATKKYLMTYTELLRQELRPYSIGVSCLLPGPTNTSFDINSCLPVPTKLKSLYCNPEFVARKAVQGMYQKKAVILPGWQTKGLYLLGKLLPIKLLYLLHKKYWVDKRSHYLHPNQKLDR